MRPTNGPPSEVERGLRRGLLAPVEYLFTAMAGTRPIPGSRGTFLVAIRRYVGAPLVLPDGTTVRRGDRLCEIHFWNRRIAARNAPTAGGVTWNVIRDFRADLGALAAAIAEGKFGGVRAVYGASPLAPAAARFGFFVRPLPAGLRRSLLTAWQIGLRRAFRPHALHSELASPTAELWMSTQELIGRYRPEPPAGTPVGPGVGGPAGAGHTRNA